MQMTRHFLGLVCAVLLVPAAAAQAGSPPRTCIDNRSIKATRFSAEQGYFVRSGSRWFQNRADGCPLFAEGRSVQTTSPANRLCKGDQVQIFQPVTSIVFGTCVLGEWAEVPETDVPKN
jgi:hypothetical protein